MTFFKISKIYATPTWCLYSAAFCAIIFSFLYWLIDKKRIMGWTYFFKPAASNPLLTYIIPDIIYYVTALLGIVIDHISQIGMAGNFMVCFFCGCRNGDCYFVEQNEIEIAVINHKKNRARDTRHLSAPDWRSCMPYRPCIIKNRSRLHTDSQ